MKSVGTVSKPVALCEYDYKFQFQITEDEAQMIFSIPGKPVKNSLDSR